MNNGLPDESYSPHILVCVFVLCRLLGGVGSALAETGCLVCVAKKCRYIRWFYAVVVCCAYPSPFDLRRINTTLGFRGACCLSTAMIR
jgi:hypothetical protein